MLKKIVEMGANNPRGGKMAAGLSLALLGATGATLGIYNSLYTVEGGHRAVMFSRYSGVKQDLIGEGTHFRWPWLESPTIFDIRTKPKTIRSPTGTRDLQMVDLTLRVLYRPDQRHLPGILQTLGQNYDERVLPSIVNETLKSVVAQFNASELITQRERVSLLIKRNLEERASDFHVRIQDVSITHMTFGKEYMAAVEAKQVAQQEAERAKFVVKQALQDKRSTVIQAQGEAQAALAVGNAVKNNPGYIELRQMQAAREIANLVARSNNKVYLDADSLLLNILKPNDRLSPSE